MYVDLVTDLMFNYYVSHIDRLKQETRMNYRKYIEELRKFGAVPEREEFTFSKTVNGVKTIFKALWTGDGVQVTSVYTGGKTLANGKIRDGKLHIESTGELPFEPLPGTVIKFGEIEYNSHFITYDAAADKFVIDGVEIDKETAGKIDWRRLLEMTPEEVKLLLLF